MKRKGDNMNKLFISKEKSQIIKSNVVKCHGISIDNGTSCWSKRHRFTSKELPSDSQAINDPRST